MTNQPCDRKAVKISFFLLSVSDTFVSFGRLAHVARLSVYITSEQELHNIGTGALKLKKNIIDNALYEKSPSIQGAAREVLDRWKNMQTENAGTPTYMQH